MIKEEEYKRRRDYLASKMSKNSVGVLFSSSYKTRSNDTEYPFRQDSNFYYMSGFKEDNSILVLIKKNKKYKSVLFVNKKDKTQELWNGKRLGKEEAKKKFLVDEVYTKDEFEKKFKIFLEGKNSLYFDFKLDYSKVKILKRYAKSLSVHKNIAKVIEKMRLIKSDAEIKLIKKAIEITKEAHTKVMKLNKSEKKEYHLQADIEYIFKSRGAYSDAYTSIVAGGNNANTLHYIDNNQYLKDGDLILLDAGCEYEYYASDITRTIPVNGKYTDEQKKVYNLVLKAQKEVFEAISPGVTRTKLQEVAVKSITKALIELGVLKGDVKKLIKNEKYKPYYPHGIGHWMGLDVHDSCPYKDEKGKEIVLAKGMVLTIEPGIYLDADDKNVPKKYRGIGIRIEDDILITENGYENLSFGIAKTIEDIESLKGK
ncbi:M24 family metallopeptidase [Sulfurimonas lithotrophica]|uniref:Xaa-Pro aminopeptidase n=1 Tax=Sulfurimonas lithotrophica TaxID=2590022 RepID=A0A5P8P2B4_9BACT|nr:aminopeptidase P N-terminal domain-containing protein [Sulfurimonas lithotrophica]QFR49747.1 M24 family metallopeptidase [Sulfurimonas lithotrophica]